MVFGMRAIELGRARHVRRDDVDFLPAQPPEIVVERHRRAALGRQEKLREHQERRLGIRGHETAIVEARQGANYRSRDEHSINPNMGAADDLRSLAGHRFRHRISESAVADNGPSLLG